MTHHLEAIAQRYRASLKPADIAWNVYVARPVAAIVVYALERTRVTPNQLTFVGALLFCVVPVVMILRPDAWGFALAVAALELSYVFDCADGQLARIKSQTSDVGAHLDYLVDEIKALLLVAGVAAGAWRASDDTVWLLVGLGGCVLVSTATSLTGFVRRREYAGETIRPGANPAGPAMPAGPVWVRGAWLVVRVARLIVHYPSWLPVVALLGLATSLDPWATCLALYLGAMALYVGRTGLAVLWRLGRRSFYAASSDDGPGPIDQDFVAAASDSSASNPPSHSNLEQEERPPPEPRHDC